MKLLQRFKNWLYTEESVGLRVEIHTPYKDGVYIYHTSDAILSTVRKNKLTGSVRLVLNEEEEQLVKEVLSLMPPKANLYTRTWALDTPSDSWGALFGLGISGNPTRRLLPWRSV